MVVVLLVVFDVAVALVRMGNVVTTGESRTGFAAVDVLLDTTVVLDGRAMGRFVGGALLTVGLAVCGR